MKQEKIISMANHIAENQQIHGEANGVANIAEHINLFWERRMRLTLLNLEGENKEKLHPMAQAALIDIKD